MSREPRKLIDLLVAVVVVALAVLGFARPASAYPPGVDLTINTKSIVDTTAGKRVEFVVRHAAPRAMVKVKFEDETKSKRASSRGVAVFSFEGPEVGRHLAAAYSGGDRASTTVYLADATLLRLRSAARSTNYVTITGAKPGEVATVEYGTKTLNRTIKQSGSAVIGFQVPARGAYEIKVYIGPILVESFSATSY
jgi:hypothetical protein